MTDRADALDQLTNERLYNAIETALSVQDRNAPIRDIMTAIRDGFPSLVFFIENGDFIKEDLGLTRLEAEYLSTIAPLARYLVGERFGERPKLDSLSSMSKYLVQLFQGIYRERFYAVLLDSAGRMAETTLISRGTDSASLFDLRMLLSAVVRTQCKYVALCHNHPRGTLRPSDEDVRCTLRAMKALWALGVPLLDHIIIAGDRAVSMRDGGFVASKLWLEQNPRSKLLREWIDVDLFAEEPTGDKDQ